MLRLLRLLRRGPVKQNVVDVCFQLISREGALHAIAQSALLDEEKGREAGRLGKRLKRVLGQHELSERMTYTRDLVLLRLWNGDISLSG